MPFVKIAGATGNFSKPQNWDDKAAGECGDLWVRVDRHGPYMQHNFAWKPDAAQLAALNAGQVIEVHIISNVMPPVGVSVHPHARPEPACEQLERTITINEHAHGDDHHGHDEHGPATP